MKRRAGLVLVLAACSVDRSVLDERVFGCESDADCASGWVCQIVDASGGFCTPRAEPGECAGVYTLDEACLAECSIESPESATGCDPSEGCLRSDALDDVGVCIGAETCNVDSDCVAGERCLSGYVIEGSHPFTLDHLSCVRGECDTDRDGEDDGVCHEDEVCVAAYWTGIWGGLGSMCLPKCGDNGLCPPGFGCYSVNGEDFGPCVPGLPAMTCRQDLDCLAGSCEEDARGEMRCRVPCESDGSVVCDADLVDPNSPAIERLTCVAGQCLARDYLSVCQTAEVCGTGFECREVDLGGETEPFDACVLPCNPLAPQTGCPDDAFCTWLAFAVAGCVRRLPDGSPCDTDDWCESSSCDRTTPCGSDELPGCCVPRE
ncbi:MAG: hypothetical protein HYY06_29130 [Deltaproteobacteria bacterium]|nr:hypothetical protein [Deltaproteobacteria bacterium]